MVSLVVTLEHNTYLCRVLQLGNMLVSKSYQLHESLYSFVVLKEWPSHHRTKFFILSLSQCFQVFWSCHLVFKGICNLIQPSYSITKIVILMSVHTLLIYHTTSYSCVISCQWWGKPHGPPSTSLFSSISTHHPRIRLRNYLVPWNLHAPMEGLLVFYNWSTSLNPDQKIPWMLDFSTFIFIRWNVLGYLRNHPLHWWSPSHLLMVFLDDY